MLTKVALKGYPFDQIKRFEPIITHLNQKKLKDKYNFDTNRIINLIGGPMLLTLNFVFFYSFLFQSSIRIKRFSEISRYQRLHE
jgi:hypothetical protein